MDISLKNMTYIEENNIGYLWLKNDQANKMTKEFYEDFLYVAQECISVNNISAIIIASKGRHYSVGVDIDMITEHIKKETIVDEEKKELKLSQWYVKLKQVFIELNEMNIPVISVIKGFCIGSGFELALNSHIRVCEKGAQLGSPEATFGFVPALGGCIRTLQVGGLHNAIELIMSGDIYSAEEADERGMIDILVEKKKGVQWAEKFLEYIFSKVNKYDKSLVNVYIEEFLNSQCN